MLITIMPDLNPVVKPMKLQDTEVLDSVSFKMCWKWNEELFKTWNFEPQSSYFAVRKKAWPNLYQVGIIA